MSTAKLIATEGFRQSNLLKEEIFPEKAYCREVVTYNGAARTFTVGTLVGANGVVPATAAAIVGVVIEEIDAPAATPTRVLTLARGPAMVSKSGLVLGALAENDVVARLLALGIVCNDAV